MKMTTTFMPIADEEESDGQDSDKEVSICRNQNPFSILCFAVFLSFQCR